MKTLFRHSRAATRLLLGLLLIDGLFIAVHVAHSLPFTKTAFPFLTAPYLSISQDLGWGEIFQYVKHIWIICLLAALYADTKACFYRTLAVLFVFFLLTDSLQLHERLGAWLAHTLSIHPVLGLRAIDIGETMGVSAIALLFLSWLIPCLIKSSRVIRKQAAVIGSLIIMLAVFSIVIDSVHIVMERFSLTLYYAVGALEDAGEMIVTSLLCGYIFMLYSQSKDANQEDSGK